MAEEGHEVWGVDWSAEMLAQRTRKVALLPGPVAARLNIVHGDVAGFDLARGFALIIAPFRAFQALTEGVDQERCLGCVKAHLADHGRFILHGFRPRAVLDRELGATGVVRLGGRRPAHQPTGPPVRAAQTHRSGPPNHPRRSYNRIDGCDQQIVESLSLSYFYAEQMRALPQRNGFQIIEKLGYFDGQPIANGPELIFVCR